MLRCFGHSFWEASCLLVDCSLPIAGIWVIAQELGTTAPACRSSFSKKSAKALGSYPALYMMIAPTASACDSSSLVYFIMRVPAPTCIPKRARLPATPPPKRPRALPRYLSTVLSTPASQNVAYKHAPFHGPSPLIIQLRSQPPPWRQR